MFVGEKLFLNILVYIVATLYWNMTGHMSPALLGYLFVTLYIIDEKLYFTAFILAIITLLLVIYFFIYDYITYEEGGSIYHLGTGVFYMLVIYLKSKSIFNAY